MNTKTIMTMAVAGALATAAFADEAFDNLVKLANTPKEQITAANAAQILDAGVAVSNATAILNVGNSKAMSFAEIFAKIKSNALFFDTVWSLAQKYGTQAEKEEAFLDYVDAWLSLDLTAQEKHLVNFANWCVPNIKDKESFMPVEGVEKAVAKVAASSSPLKANALALMLYIYDKRYWDERLNALCEQQFDTVKNAILDGSFKPRYQVFDFVAYVAVARRDTALAVQLLNNIKWYAPYSKSVRIRCPYLGSRTAGYEPTLSNLRKQYIESVAQTDFQLTTVAKEQDLVDGNKKATESIFNRLTEPSFKLSAALYLHDNDKIVDTLLTIDNSISASDIEKSITVINTFDPDYRAADVLKALRVINKKYTLKLYDDRDTWEPILSKVRALIDTYNN